MNVKIKRCKCREFPEIVLYGCFSEISEMAGLGKTNMYYGIKCYHCGSQTKRFKNKLDAITDWNENARKTA